MTPLSPLLARLAAPLLLCAALAWSPQAAHAQDFVTPDPAQYRLYEEGAQAFRLGDYEKAVELFRASLHLGELNITYLNLGRALFKLGRCPEAVEAYNNALHAPAVENPSPAQVRQKLAEYKADMMASCPGYMILACNPDDAEDLRIYLDQQPRACTDELIPLAPGVHILSSERAGKRMDQEVKIAPMETIEVAPWPKDGSPKLVQGPDPQSPDPDPSDPWGLSLWLHLGASLGGQGGYESAGKLDGEEVGSAAAFTGGSGALLEAAAFYDLWSSFGVGALLSLSPNLKPSFESVTVGGATTFSALDLQLLARVRVLPWLHALGGVGLSSLTPTDASTDPAFSGFSLRLGLSSQSDLYGWLISYGADFVGYTVARDYENDADDADIELHQTLQGSRILLHVGLGFDL